MKGYRKLLLITLIMTIILLINSFTQMFNLFTYSLFLLASFLVIRKLMGFESDDFPDKKEIIIILVSSIFFYYALTYSTVFFWGILKNRIGFTFTSFANNIIPLFLIILFTELLRFIIIRKGRGYKSIWVIAVLLFSLIEITIKLKGYNFGISIDILKFSIEVLAVTIVKNIFLCYLANRIGYKGTIIFRFLYELPLYILPFFPNLGIFIDSVLKMLFPAIILFLLIYKYSLPNEKDKTITQRQTKIFKRIGYATSILFILIIVGLSCTKFKYFTIVVGSGSMSPNIEKGDVVLIQKVKDIKSLKENDILVFKHDNITVIHRIIEIELEDGRTIFYTKGDANKSEDNYPVEKKDVIGTAIFKIKYIGYPTVWINEQIK